MTPTAMPITLKITDVYSNVSRLQLEPDGKGALLTVTGVPIPWRTITDHVVRLTSALATVTTPQQALALAQQHCRKSLTIEIAAPRGATTAPTQGIWDALKGRIADWRLLQQTFPFDPAHQTDEERATIAWEVLGLVETLIEAIDAGQPWPER